ncbi:precorrin-6y C5,15-methyltransferase (decarboxylating) subunit CbiE [Nocardioides sp. AE5]|uniref:precorrin-6y C5,15-methyltransferase (decarboxylating) subunit CbiE n=1 Tax=Nocardioides sp. AE5 TaxID=2962573 RepID=UPI002882BBF7|nr:precorrin-6y C5,15-methyltransferase (decarboxylating) subunit CbiE [Nocardioides sp. AE5]MDT0202195.1 precorrin-6y C5,15-methyltransferase (decarboxylating) subunit CbiE [Nocardioides sp. AE5]
MSPHQSVTVIGIGADGWEGLPVRLRTRVLEAGVVLGGARHLALLPPADQARVPWPRPLRERLPVLLAEYADRSVVALASGDPMLSGIGTTLVGLLGAEAVDVHPAVSSVALARARMGWSAESTYVVSLVGRPLERVLAALAPGRRLLVLSADETTPGALAGLLTAAGHGEARMSVLGDLGAEEESRIDALAREWSQIAAVPRLNLVALAMPEAREAAAGGTQYGSWVAGLPDDAFEHDGQLTKRDLRASALARLAPMPGQLLWDVGAGAGSIGIEWMRAHPTCRTIAVEAHPERAARVTRNAHALGVPDLVVVEGRSPEALDGLERPDAIFIGGGARGDGLLEKCQEALRPGGRLVVHGVTLETEALLATAYAAHGGELTRIGVETAAPIGGLTGWTPARAVTQWAWTKEAGK